MRIHISTIYEINSLLNLIMPLFAIILRFSKYSHVRFTDHMHCHIQKHICCQMPIWFRIFGTVHVTKTTTLSKRNEFSDNFLLIEKYYIQLLFLCNNAQLMIVITNVIKYLIIESNCNKNKISMAFFLFQRKMI